MITTAPLALKLVPDCQTCEPAERWSQPNKGVFTVINEMTGETRHVCGSCLEAGVAP